MHSAELQREWHALCDRWDRSGYAALSDDERMWFNIRSLIDAVENGGLVSYFYNPGADTWPDCRAALRRIGAEDVVAHVDRVAALFGAEVPSSLEARNRILDGWSEDEDQLLEEIDEELMPMMDDLEVGLESFLRGARIGGE